MKKENENAALLSMFDELSEAVKKNGLAIHYLQDSIISNNTEKMINKVINSALNEKFPKRSKEEIDEDFKKLQENIANWTISREKILFEQYIKPTLNPLNEIDKKFEATTRYLINEYRKERESQKMAYYKTMAIVILSSLLLISILIICLV